MLHRLSLKRQFYVISTAFLIGSVVLGIFIIYPTIHAHSSVSDDIKVIQQELEIRYNDTQAMRRTLRELDSVNKEIETYKSFVIPHGEEVHIIEQLEMLAQEHALDQTLGASFTDTPDSAVGLPYYTFSFVLTGTFEDMFTYLQTLESQPYYIIIQGIDFRRGTEPGTASLRFDARMYARQMT